MVTDTKIRLHDVRGMGEEFMYLDGLDENGKLWIFRRRNAGCVCTMCQETMTEGWSNTDNEETVCSRHVSFKGEMGKGAEEKK
jgi:hypothetical protein